MSVDYVEHGGLDSLMTGAPVIVGNPSTCSDLLSKAVLEGGVHGASIRDRSRTVQAFFTGFLALAQRASTALRALALRSAAVSFAARALPPFSPPRRPRATAAGFFLLFAMRH